MVCKKCNKRIKKGTQICPHCDAPQTETVSLGAINAAKVGKKKKPNRLRKWLWAAAIVLLSLAVLISGTAIGVWKYLDTQLPDVEVLDEEELNVNPELPPSGVINIALFGLDNRYDNDEGRSDAIIILSVDYDHNKIKLTSIARDTLVYVEGYPSKQNRTKITHAFAYGGAELAVKTLNQNFAMNITRYMFVNFHEFSRLIDMVGGVEIDVQEREIYQMNKHIRGMVKKSGLDIEEISSAGMQTLTGGQALAYARLRKIDSDVVRGNRQKAVLEAAFKKVRKMPVTKLPALVSEALSICNTNLTSAEILKIGTWAMTNSPEFISYSLPDDTCKAWGGIHPDYAWVYMMDMDYATARLHDFIYETNKSESMTPVRYTGK